MFIIEFSHQAAAVHQYEMLSRQQGSTTQVTFQFCLYAINKRVMSNHHFYSLCTIHMRVLGAVL